MTSLSLRLEFSGGLESLFEDQKHVCVTPPESVETVGALITWVKTKLITHNHDLFMAGDNLRPGVLVLINDVDWELEETTKYQLREGDRIAFISTLHGG